MRKIFGASCSVAREDRLRLKTWEKSLICQESHDTLLCVSVAPIVLYERKS